MNKKSIIILISFILIFSGCTNNLTSNKQNLNFSTSACDYNIINQSSQQSKQIINKSWINNDTLIINAYIHATCGGCSLKGDYEITENNSIILKTSETCGDNVLNCVCPTMITYKISNLQKHNYTILLK